jgi:hypothetical protein
MAHVTNLSTLLEADDLRPLIIGGTSRIKSGRQRHRARNWNITEETMLGSGIDRVKGTSFASIHQSGSLVHALGMSSDDLIRPW